ncbi:hypothetical protein Dimus_019620 [Dionaea muscipula]
MAEETHVAVPATALKKRKRGNKKSGKLNKKNMGMARGMGKRVKIDKKMKKLFRKRAREYNSDDDDDDDELPGEDGLGFGRKRVADGMSSDDGDDEVEDAGERSHGSNDDEEEVQPLITKFTEGCKAFKVAFLKIMKSGVDDESLGPILSAHKKLVATKLVEEETEKKFKGEVKKEKHLIAEKGHVKPANFLDSEEKFLISLATKGVVKLFNAINKAQIVARHSDPSTSKNEKALRKRRNEVFFSELKKSQSADVAGKASFTRSRADSEQQPSWAPLRDSYMLTNSKLKDWDKMADTAVDDQAGRIQDDSSNDEDED